MVLKFHNFIQAEFLNVGLLDSQQLCIRGNETVDRGIIILDVDDHGRNIYFLYRHL